MASWTKIKYISQCWTLSVGWLFSQLICVVRKCPVPLAYGKMKLGNNSTTEKKGKKLNTYVHFDRKFGLMLMWNPFCICKHNRTAKLIKEQKLSTHAYTLGSLFTHSHTMNATTLTGNFVPKRRNKQMLLRVKRYKFPHFFSSSKWTSIRSGKVPFICSTVHRYIWYNFLLF